MTERSIDALTAEEAAAELARLASDIAAHDALYYSEAAPTVSDADWYPRNKLGGTL